MRLARAVLVDNVTRPLAHLVASPEIRGDEHLVGVEAPVIFASNHLSHVDTPLLLSCLPLRFRHRTVVAAAADYFFDRRWKADLWSFALAAFPIDRSRVNRRSAELAAELLEDDWNLVIFPEGGRSPDGWGQDFRGGAAYLSARTGRPVVPVHLDGTRHILPKGGGTLRRTRTSITFGTPIVPDEGESARRFGARIEAAVAVLADEAATDWWTARRQAARGETPSLRGPTWPRGDGPGPCPWPRTRSTARPPPVTPTPDPTPGRRPGCGRAWPTWGRTGSMIGFVTGRRTKWVVLAVWLVILGVAGSVGPS